MLVAYAGSNRVFSYGMNLSNNDQDTRSTRGTHGFTLEQITSTWKKMEIPIFIVWLCLREIVFILISFTFPSHM